MVLKGIEMGFSVSGETTRINVYFCYALLGGHSTSAEILS